LLATEIAISPAASAFDRERCLKNCATAVTQLENACKARGMGGKCEGAFKKQVKNVEKVCHDDCDRRQARHK